MRPCAAPGCPVLTDATYCAEHARQRDRARGTTTERGYGAEHQRARDELREQLPAACWYGCGTWLEVTDRWVAAHVEDGNPDAGWVISCPPCNERAKRRA